eukprot:Ihof_evm7s49 gene=Ihof_evmTU7s49
MSSYAVAKSSKLTFKGETQPKKKKQKHKRKAEETVDKKSEFIHGSWWPVGDIDQVTGPVIFQLQDGKYLLAEVSATFKAGELRDTDDPEGFDPAEVFTVVPLGGGKMAIKSGYDRYLGVNPSGRLTGYAEAIGQLETWEGELVEGLFHLKASIGKYLAVREDGSATCEEKDQSTATGMRVWSAATPPTKKAKLEKAGDVEKFEKDAVKRYQSYLGKGFNPSSLEKTELKSALKEGNLSGTLLDRRAKAKAD